MHIVLDTSSILFGFSNNINIFSRALEKFPGGTIVISKGVIKELSRIAEGRGKASGYAKVALQEIEALKKHIEIESSHIYVDRWIEGKAKNSEYIICTNDTALRKRVRRSGAKVFALSRSGAFS